MCLRRLGWFSYPLLNKKTILTITMNEEKKMTNCRRIATLFFVALFSLEASSREEDPTVLWEKPLLGGVWFVSMGKRECCYTRKTIKRRF